MERATVSVVFMWGVAFFNAPGHPHCPQQHLCRVEIWGESQEDRIWRFPGGQLGVQELAGEDIWNWAGIGGSGRQGFCSERLSGLRAEPGHVGHGAAESPQTTAQGALVGGRSTDPQTEARTVYTASQKQGQDSSSTGT